MRYALAALALVVAALAWWAARDEPAPRGETASEIALVPPRPGESHGVLVEECFAEPDGLLLVGRVVADRKPAAGAHVTAEIHGQGRFEARAGDDGTYSLRAGSRPERGYVPVRVEARLGDRGASADLALSPRSLDRIRVPTLVLGPLHPFMVTVLGGGKPLSGARVVTGEPARPGGVSVTGDDGRVELLLPPGEHEIRAACDGFGRAEATASVPESSAISIELPRERTVAVTVVEKTSARPVAGAVLALHEEREGASLQLFSPPVEPAPTDERGVTVLRGLAEETVVRVAVRAPGYPPPTGDVGKETIHAGITEFRIELPPPRTIRWPVVAGELPAPPDGTPIALRPSPSSYLREVPAAGVMDRGHLVVDGLGPGPVHAIAEEPGGGLAFLQAGAAQEIGPPISFRKPRRVDVFAHEPSGAPVEGAAFLLRAAPAPLGLTDAEGKLAFQGLAGGRADVFHLPNPASEWGMSRVGIVDLDAGDGLVDVLLRPAVELVVRVRVEGEPAIPSGCELYADSAPVVAEEDFERGILRAQVRPAGDSIEIALGAPGFAPVRTKTRTGEVEIDLRSGATLAVEVIKPPEVETAVEVQVWREDANAWTEVFLPIPADYRKLAAGRYRAVDLRSGAASDEVRLENGDAGRLVLDLSRTGVVRGRVEMPEGTEMAYVYVQVSGTEIRGVEQNRVGVMRDGTFRVGVPGDREITLRASHPTLRAANEVALTRPRDDVVLRLEPGPTATVELDRAPWDPIHMKPEVPVRLYRGEPEGEPVARLRASVTGGTLAFGGFEPGAYSVWIDPRPFAPVTLRGVALGDGANDLGRVATGPGSKVHVRILVAEGQVAPRVSLRAWRTTEPRYSRNVDSRGESEVTLSGLGPGTFRVSAEPIWSGVSRRRLEQEVALDGTETREVVLDLR